MITSNPHGITTTLTRMACHGGILPRHLATHRSEKCKKCGRSTNMSCSKAGYECGEAASAVTQPRASRRMGAISCKPDFSVRSHVGQKQRGKWSQIRHYWDIVMKFYQKVIWRVGTILRKGPIHIVLTVERLRSKRRARCLLSQ